MPKSFTQSSVLSRQSFDLLFLILLIAYVFAGAPLVPFHGDELTILFMSRDYGYQFMQRNLDLVRFQLDPPLPEQQYLRLINGSVAKYSYGLAWHLAGYTVDDVNDQWEWSGDWDYNISANHMPAPGILMAARWMSSLFLAGSVVVLFLLARTLGGRGVAYLTSAYYALNPAILINGRRAVFESTNLFFGLLVVLVGVYYLRKPSLGRGLLLGAVSGLALASKHQNLFVVVAVFGACLLYPMVARRLPFRGSRAALYLILAALLTAVVFVALNPVWWGSNPTEHLRLVLGMRQNLLNVQVEAFGGYPSRLEQLAGFGRQVLVGYPQYYEAPAFGPWIADQIAVYEASPWRGVSIGGSLPGALVMLVLVVFGAWSFLRDRAIALSSRWIVALWSLALLLTTVALTPIEWQRYYVPVFPIVGLFAAFGIVWLFRRLRPPQKAL